MKFTSKNMPGGAALCYVRDGFAWFTTQPLDKQRGDDWDDAPYECNAGEPYDPDGGDDWRLYVVAFQSQLYEPYERDYDNGWSVDAINRGETPWLTGRWRKDPPRIMGGCTLKDFVATILADGGVIFAPVEGVR